MNNDWLINLIENNGLIKKIGPDGQEMIVEVGKEAFSFIKANAGVLSRLGVEGFTQTLQMIKAGKESDAKIALMEQMSNWELIDTMNQTADAIAAAAKFQEDFKNFMFSLFLTIGKSVASKLLLALL